jgi:CheY-like chemotaxis protein
MGDGPRAPAELDPGALLGACRQAVSGVHCFKHLAVAPGRWQLGTECRRPRCVDLGIVTRFLLADDDPSALEFLRLALSTRDVEIKEATSGAELLSLLTSDGPYDLVVTDVAMSWMSGLQAIAAVRTAGLSTPALVVTGLSDPSLVERVSRLGRVGLLQKPVGVEELLGAIDALLVVARSPS